MKMNAVKETCVANLICGVLESEHGKIELVFEGWDDGTKTAQYLERFTIAFHGEVYVVDEKHVIDFGHGEFKEAVQNIAEKTWYKPYEWDELAQSLLESAELQQLLGSAVSYLNMKLWPNG